MCVCVCESAVCDKERLRVNMLYVKESCVKGSVLQSCIYRQILCERLCVKEDNLRGKELCLKGCAGKSCVWKLFVRERGACDNVVCERTVW